MQKSMESQCRAHQMGVTCLPHQAPKQLHFVQTEVGADFTFLFKYLFYLKSVHLFKLQKIQTVTRQ